MLSTPVGSPPGARTTPFETLTAGAGFAVAGAVAAGVVETPEALSTTAAITLSLAPAFLRAMSPFADVSYLPGDELIVVTIRSAERPAFTILVTDSLLIGC